eukprot:g1996.t1
MLVKAVARGIALHEGVDETMFDTHWNEFAGVGATSIPEQVLYKAIAQLRPPPVEDMIPKDAARHFAVEHGMSGVVFDDHWEEIAGKDATEISKKAMLAAVNKEAARHFAVEQGMSNNEFKMYWRKHSHLSKKEIFDGILNNAAKLAAAAAAVKIQSIFRGRQLRKEPEGRLLHKEVAFNIARHDGLNASSFEKEWEKLLGLDSRYVPEVTFYRALANLRRTRKIEELKELQMLEKSKNIDQIVTEVRAVSLARRFAKRQKQRMDAKIEDHFKGTLSSLHLPALHRLVMDLSQEDLKVFGSIFPDLQPYLFDYSGNLKIKLPKNSGWIKVISAKNTNVFYYHTLGRSQWEPPSLVQLHPNNTALPQNNEILHLKNKMIRQGRLVQYRNPECKNNKAGDLGLTFSPLWYQKILLLRQEQLNQLRRLLPGAIPPFNPNPNTDERPYGWQLRVSKSNDLSFWFHSDSGCAQWSHPNQKGISVPVATQIREGDQLCEQANIISDVLGKGIKFSTVVENLTPFDKYLGKKVKIKVETSAGEIGFWQSNVLASRLIQMRELYRRYEIAGRLLSAAHTENSFTDPFYNSPSSLLIGVASISVEPIMNVKDSGIQTAAILDQDGKQHGWLVVRIQTKILRHEVTTNKLTASANNTVNRNTKQTKESITETSVIQLQAFARGWIVRKNVNIAKCVDVDPTSYISVNVNIPPGAPGPIGISLRQGVGGIGAVVSMLHDLHCMAVTAGVCVGWKIIAIDGHSVEDCTFHSIVMQCNAQVDVETSLCFRPMNMAEKRQFLFVWGKDSLHCPVSVAAIKLQRIFRSRSWRKTISTSFLENKEEATMPNLLQASKILFSAYEKQRNRLFAMCLYRLQAVGLLIAESLSKNASMSLEDFNRLIRESCYEEHTEIVASFNRELSKMFSHLQSSTLQSEILTEEFKDLIESRRKQVKEAALTRMLKCLQSLKPSLQDQYWQSILSTSALAGSQLYYNRRVGTLSWITPQQFRVKIAKKHLKKMNTKIFSSNSLWENSRHKHAASIFDINWTPTVQRQAGKFVFLERKNKKSTWYQEYVVDNYVSSTFSSCALKDYLGMPVEFLLTVLSGSGLSGLDLPRLKSVQVEHYDPLRLRSNDILEPGYDAVVKNYSTALITKNTGAPLFRYKFKSQGPITQSLIHNLAKEKKFTFRVFGMFVEGEIPWTIDTPPDPIEEKEEKQKKILREKVNELASVYAELDNAEEDFISMRRKEEALAKTSLEFAEKARKDRNKAEVKRNNLTVKHMESKRNEKQIASKFCELENIKIEKEKKLLKQEKSCEDAAKVLENAKQKVRALISMEADADEMRENTKFDNEDAKEKIISWEFEFNKRKKDHENAIVQLKEQRLKLKNLRNITRMETLRFQLEEDAALEANMSALTNQAKEMIETWTLRQKEAAKVEEQAKEAFISTTASRIASEKEFDNAKKLLEKLEREKDEISNEVNLAVNIASGQKRKLDTVTRNVRKLEVEIAECETEIHRLLKLAMKHDNDANIHFVREKAWRQKISEASMKTLQAAVETANAKAKEAKMEKDNAIANMKRAELRLQAECGAAKMVEHELSSWMKEAITEAEAALLNAKKSVSVHDFEYRLQMLTSKSALAKIKEVKAQKRNFELSNTVQIAKNKLRNARALLKKKKDQSLFVNNNVHKDLVLHVAVHHNQHLSTILSTSKTAREEMEKGLYDVYVDDLTKEEKDKLDSIVKKIKSSDGFTISEREELRKLVRKFQDWQIHQTQTDHAFLSKKDAFKEFIAFATLHHGAIVAKNLSLSESSFEHVHSNTTKPSKAEEDKFRAAILEMDEIRHAYQNSCEKEEMFFLKDLLEAKKRNIRFHLKKFHDWKVFTNFSEEGKRNHLQKDDISAMVTEIAKREKELKSVEKKFEKDKKELRNIQRDCASTKAALEKMKTSQKVKSAQIKLEEARKELNDALALEKGALQRRKVCLDVGNDLKTTLNDTKNKIVSRNEDAKKHKENASGFHIRYRASTIEVKHARKMLIGVQTRLSEQRIMMKKARDRIEENWKIMAESKRKKNQFEKKDVEERKKVDKFMAVAEVSEANAQKAKLALKEAHARGEERRKKMREEKLKDTANFLTIVESGGSENHTKVQQMKLNRNLQIEKEIESELERIENTLKKALQESKELRSMALKALIKADKCKVDAKTELDRLVYSEKVVKLAKNELNGRKIELEDLLRAEELHESAYRLEKSKQQRAETEKHREEEAMRLAVQDVSAAKNYVKKLEKEIVKNDKALQKCKDRVAKAQLSVEKCKNIYSIAESVHTSAESAFKRADFEHRLYEGEKKIEKLMPDLKILEKKEGSAEIELNKWSSLLSKMSTKDRKQREAVASALSKLEDYSREADSAEREANQSKQFYELLEQEKKWVLQELSKAEIQAISISQKNDATHEALDKCKEKLKKAKKDERISKLKAEAFRISLEKQHFILKNLLKGRNERKLSKLETRASEAKQLRAECENRTISLNAELVSLQASTTTSELILEQAKAVFEEAKKEAFLGEEKMKIAKQNFLQVTKKAEAMKAELENLRKSIAENQPMLIKLKNSASRAKTKFAALREKRSESLEILRKSRKEVTEASLGMQKMKATMKASLFALKMAKNAKETFKAKRINMAKQLAEKAQKDIEEASMQNDIDRGSQVSIKAAQLRQKRIDEERKFEQRKKLQIDLQKLLEREEIAENARKQKRDACPTVKGRRRLDYRFQKERNDAAIKIDGIISKMLEAGAGLFRDYRQSVHVVRNQSENNREINENWWINAFADAANISKNPDEVNRLSDISSRLSSRAKSRRLRSRQESEEYSLEQKKIEVESSAVILQKISRGFLARTARRRKARAAVLIQLQVRAISRRAKSRRAVKKAVTRSRPEVQDAIRVRSGEIKTIIQQAGGSSDQILAASQRVRSLFDGASSSNNDMRSSGGLYSSHGARKKMPKKLRIKRKAIKTLSTLRTEFKRRGIRPEVLWKLMKRDAMKDEVSFLNFQKALQKCRLEIDVAIWISLKKESDYKISWNEFINGLFPDRSSVEILNKDVISWLKKKDRLERTKGKKRAKKLKRIDEKKEEEGDVANDTIKEILFVAAEGDSVWLREIISFNPGIEKKCDDQGFQAIHAAAQAGAISTMSVLIEFGVSICTADHFGRQPLHYAVVEGEFQAVKWLIKNGASLTASDCHLRNVLMYAAFSGQWKLLRWMILHLEKKSGPLFQSFLFATDNFGATIFHYLASVGEIDIFKYLLQLSDVNINSVLMAKMKDGTTVRDIAIKEDLIPMLQFIDSEQEHSRRRLAKGKLKKQMMNK